MSAKIVYDMSAMKFMSLFETITRAKLKDCIIKENLVLFIVHPNEIGKAVGAKGVNVRKLEKVLNKKVKIVEFSPEPVNFIKNLVHPLKVKEITEEEGIYTLTPVDLKTRGLLIGRNASHLRAYEDVVKRYFPVKELKVI
ncbi:NusA-like transcription termination signal-binding factor [Candidatus Woesearchaeota archaeon]|nr:NusA-like transcription termination signal-binding factor [Candidatus Woesearchaeota archaeon]MBW3005563.1 NusA-like transcription termination signal-binding factor [Candidatus Woesearchaeota archaeon]